MNYLDHTSKTQPLIVACWVLNEDKIHTDSIEYPELLKRTGNVDPFSIPDGTDPNDARILALRHIRFMAAFKARVGLPDTDPENLPPIVELGGDITSVVYRPLCSEFTIASLTMNAYDEPLFHWTRATQDPRNPWIFVSRVDLSKTIMAEEDVKNLDQDVQDHLKTVSYMSGGEFDIEQLSFDLATARLSQMPDIESMPGNTTARGLLKDYFLSHYVAEMQRAGKPILGVSAVVRQPSVSTLTLTDFHFYTNPYVGLDGVAVPKPTPEQTKCTTLNYLCAANHHPLPAVRTFPFNWVDTKDMSQHDGIVSINRNAVVNYFHIQIAPLLAKYCIKPNVSCWTSGAIAQFGIDFSPNQSPLTTRPPSGELVLSYFYGATDKDQAGNNGTLGQIEATYTFSLQVTFRGTQVIINQSQILHIFLQKLATHDSADVIKNTIVDTYSIGIDEQGGIVFKAGKPDSHSDPDTLDAGPLADAFIHFSDVVDKLTRQTTIECTKLASLPLETVQSFVFPGGRTFTFSDVGFSNNQDLVSTIRYADVKAPPVKMVPLPRSTRFKSSHRGY